MKKRLLTSGFALALFGSVALAACSSDDGGTTNADAPKDETETSEEASSDSGSGEELSVLIAQPQAGAGGILSEEYEAATGTKVNITVVPYDQIQTIATLDFQSGTNEYDVIQYWYTSVGALAEAGAIIDLTDWITDELDKDDFIDSIFVPYTEYEGQNYGVPIDGDSHVLFYNKEILERNNVEPPTTWDEYLNAVKTITENESADGVYGTALLGMNSSWNMGSTFYNRLVTMEADKIDPQFPDLSTPGALEAAQAMVDAAEYAYPTPLETGFEQALAAFLGGNVGMMEAWTDLGAFAQDPGQSNIVDNWGVVALPVGENGSVGGALNAGWVFGISPSADEDLAKDFVKFSTSTEMNLQLSTTTGSGIDPIRYSVLDSEEYRTFAPEVSAVVEQVFPEAQSWPTTPQAPEMITALYDNLALMLSGSLTPEEALSKTTEAWESINN